MSSDRYDAVIFDLHGTLVPWCRDELRAMLLQMADAIGVGGDDFVRVMGEIVHESMTGRFGSMAAEVGHICRTLGVHAGAESIERAVRLWSDFHWQSYEKPYCGGLDLLLRLKDNGLRTGLITNCGLEAPELWQRSQFAPHVDAAVFSAAEGLLKPDLRIYSRASERLGVSPERCLYVDDSAACLAGAKDAGMDTLLIRHPANMIGLEGVDEWTGPVVSSLGEVFGYISSWESFGTEVTN